MCGVTARGFNLNRYIDPPSGSRPLSERRDGPDPASTICGTVSLTDLLRWMCLGSGGGASDGLRSAGPAGKTVFRAAPCPGPEAAGPVPKHIPRCRKD